MQTTDQQMYNSTFTDLNPELVPSSFPVTEASSINCFIDAQLAFLVAAAASSIILILLISTIVLACTVSRLKRPHRRAPRQPRSNVDLVSGTSYWGTKRREGGIIGSCETSVLLEEIKSEEEEAHDGRVEPRQDINTTNAVTHSENDPKAMLNSASKA